MSERIKFESWMSERWPGAGLERDHEGDYYDGFTRGAWEGWMWWHVPSSRTARGVPCEWCARGNEPIKGIHHVDHGIQYLVCSAVENPP